jgi:uncharacterized protein YdhG (YjbR/CyaY superfamily)
MAKADCQSVDEYIASQPDAIRPILRQVRNAIRKAVPEADELISYNIPTYKLKGEPVLYFAGWKQHFSLYPVFASLLAALRHEIAPYVVSKGTMRFSLSQPVPAKLIGLIAEFRAKEVAAVCRRRQPPLLARSSPRCGDGPSTTSQS